MLSKVIQITVAALLALAIGSSAQNIHTSETAPHYLKPTSETNKRSLRQLVSKRGSATDRLNEEGRRLFSWTAFFTFSLHGPLAHHPPPNNDGGGSGGGESTGSGNSGGGGDDDGTHNGGGSYYGDDDVSGGGSYYGDDDGSGGGSYHGDDDGSGSHSVSNGSDGRGGVNTGSSFSRISTSAASVTMFLIAAAAAGVAIGAVALGRRQQPVTTHPLRGGLNRRINLFSEFANKSKGNIRPLSQVEVSGGDMGAGADYSQA